jgi:gliding motility-associated-like protein
MKFICRYIFYYFNLLLAAFCLSLLLPAELFSQILVNNGHNIFVNTGAYVIVSGDYINETSSTIPGKIDLDGTMIVRGDWLNQSPENNVLINIEKSPNGLVKLDSKTLQHIGGNNSTTFENLTIENANKMLDITDNTIKGKLTVDAALLLNSKKIIIDNPNPSSITYRSKYILSETPPLPGYGEVQWNIGSQTGTYQIPFGTGANNNDLNLGLTTTTAGQDANGKITFATYRTDCNNLPIPTGVSGLSSVLPEYIADRYWIIDPDYSNRKPDVDIDFTYTDKDIALSCNPNINADMLIGESYCKDCGNSWKTAGTSYATTRKVLVKGVPGSQCYAPWRLLSNDEETTVFYPNAFTPNIVGMNDIFLPVGMSLDLLTNYKLMIFDRWGDRIFQSDNIHTGWDGKFKNTGKLALQGVYVWVAEYTNKMGMHKRQIGKVTLL